MSIMLLLRLPTNQILFVSTRAMSSAMATSARMDWTLTSSGVNTTCVPVICTELQSTLVILVLRTNIHFFLCKNMSKGVWLMASCC